MVLWVGGTPVVSGMVGVRVVPCSGGVVSVWGCAPVVVGVMDGWVCTHCYAIPSEV